MYIVSTNKEGTKSVLVQHNIATELVNWLACMLSVTKYSKDEKYSFDERGKTRNFSL